ncbi:retrovirus-related pol polyprotein from transposon TNT 1-94 [Tanacetum coccineum]
MVKIEMPLFLNARCSAVLQNELPPKEKDPGHFILPLIVGNTTVSNALADLGASSVMPFSMFKRLGLGNPKLINMMIEMADISMQSPKDIVKNVLVKIHNLIFLVDFVILDIIEDDKVPIILGRPMLATAHAKIDVFGKNISLEVGTEQIVFNANKGTHSLIVSPICIINDDQVIDDLGDPEGLEEVLMNEDINKDLGNFLKENGLLPNFDGQEAISFSPSCSLKINKDSFGTFRDSNNNMSIKIDDFEINNI